LIVIVDHVCMARTGEIGVAAEGAVVARERRHLGCSGIDEVFGHSGLLPGRLSIDLGEAAA
jgi:hypothetical protein